MSNSKKIKKPSNKNTATKVYKKTWFCNNKRVFGFSSYYIITIVLFSFMLLFAILDCVIAPPIYAIFEYGELESAAMFVIAGTLICSLIFVLYQAIHLKITAKWRREGWQELDLFQLGLLLSSVAYLVFSICFIFVPFGLEQELMYNYKLLIILYYFMLFSIVAFNTTVFAFFIISVKENYTRKPAPSVVKVISR